MSIKWDFFSNFVAFSQYLKFNPTGISGDRIRWPLRLVSTWFENVLPGRACMGVLQALARAKGHIIPVSAFMPLLMASWTSILEGLSSPTRVVVLCVLYIVVEVVLRGTTTFCKNTFCRKICMKINLFFQYFISFEIPFVGKQKTMYGNWRFWGFTFIIYQ